MIEVVIAPSTSRARAYCEVDRDPPCSVRDTSQVYLALRPERLRGIRLGASDKLTFLQDGWEGQHHLYVQFEDMVTYLEKSRARPAVC